MHLLQLEEVSPQHSAQFGWQGVHPVATDEAGLSVTEVVVVAVPTAFPSPDGHLVHLPVVKLVYLKK